MRRMRRTAQVGETRVRGGAPARVRRTLWRNARRPALLFLFPSNRGRCYCVCCAARHRYGRRGSLSGMVWERNTTTTLSFRRLGTQTNVSKNTLEKQVLPATLIRALSCVWSFYRDLIFFIFYEENGRQKSVFCVPCTWIVRRVRRTRCGAPRAGRGSPPRGGRCVRVLARAARIGARFSRRRELCAGTALFVLCDRIVRPGERRRRGRWALWCGARDAETVRGSNGEFLCFIGRAPKRSAPTSPARRTRRARPAAQTRRRRAARRA